MNIVKEKYVYRICTKEECNNLQKNHFFLGNNLDKESGFIHLSLKNQIKGTLQKYFKEDEQLILLKLSIKLLGEKLRWEKSRNNQYFPHYYGEISVKQIVEITKI